MMTFKQIWKRWTLISFILVIIFLVYQTMNLPSCEVYYEQEKEIHYNGIITKKFIDEKEHNYPIIKIDEGEKIIVYNLSSDISGLFDFLKEGDRVIKRQGTNNIVVQRDGKEASFTLDYGCE
jgi:hypothetical protein